MCLQVHPLFHTIHNTVFFSLRNMIWLSWLFRPLEPRDINSLTYLFTYLHVLGLHSIQLSHNQACRGYGYRWIYPCVDIWYRFSRVISLMRFSDINNRVCVGDADAALETQTPCCYCRFSIFLSFFLFFFLFHFLTEICTCFFLERWQSLQNDLYSWSIILFCNLT